MNLCNKVTMSRDLDCCREVSVTVLDFFLIFSSSNFLFISLW